MQNIFVQTSPHISSEIIDGGSRIPLTWRPFAFIPNTPSGGECLPTGFRHRRIAPGSVLTGTPIAAPGFVSALGGGGTLVTADSTQAWTDLLHDDPAHPLCDALHDYTKHPESKKFHTRRTVIDLSEPKIMAIWNVTPDSFSSFCEADGAGTDIHARKLCEDGADILDIGAESTRPGAAPVTQDQETERLRHPLEWAKNNARCPISLDSRNIGTIRWALDNKLTDIINDVALTTDTDGRREQDICRKVAETGAGLVIMAWQPHDTPQKSFCECIGDIITQLDQRMQCAYQHGLDMRQIVVDPGIGFGKGLDNDLQLITQAPGRLEPLGRPVLIAHSRKRCLAKATGLPIEQLDTSTAISAALSISAGAAIIRVHTPALARLARLFARASEFPK